MIDTLECFPFGTSRWRSDFLNSGRDECGNFLYWTNTIPNASAVLLRRNILKRAGGPPRDMRLAGDWVTYVNMLAISDIAFVSAPLNYFRFHDRTVRSRLSDDLDVAVFEMIRLQTAIMSACGMPEHLREHGEALTNFVGYWISLARRPPHNKVPARASLALLMSFARLHPKALSAALGMLSWELMADVARRAGILGLAQAAKMGGRPGAMTVVKMVGRVQDQYTHEVPSI